MTDARDLAAIRGLQEQADDAADPAVKAALEKLAAAYRDSASLSAELRDRADDARRRERETYLASALHRVDQQRVEDMANVLVGRATAAWDEERPYLTLTLLLSPDDRAALHRVLDVPNGDAIVDDHFWSDALHRITRLGWRVHTWSVIERGPDDSSLGRSATVLLERRSH